MRTIDAIRRSGVGIGPDRTIREAAQVMDQAGVGSLAVIDGEVLVGIVTDRDLVRRALARDLPSTRESTRSCPHQLSRSTPTRICTKRSSCFGRTQFAGSLSCAGRFVGMITIDDLLVDLAGDLSDLARPVTAEVVFGHHDYPTPATISE